MGGGIVGTNFSHQCMALLSLDGFLPFLIFYTAFLWNKIQELVKYLDYYYFISKNWRLFKIQFLKPNENKNVRNILGCESLKSKKILIYFWHFKYTYFHILIWKAFPIPVPMLTHIWVKLESNNRWKWHFYYSAFPFAIKNYSKQGKDCIVISYPYRVILGVERKQEKYALTRFSVVNLQTARVVHNESFPILLYHQINTTTNHSNQSLVGTENGRQDDPILYPACCVRLLTWQTGKCDERYRFVKGRKMSKSVTFF